MSTEITSQVPLGVPGLGHCIFNADCIEAQDLIGKPVTANGKVVGKVIAAGIDDNPAKLTVTLTVTDRVLDEVLHGRP